MKYMGSYYHGMTTIALKQLRSKKVMRLAKLEGDAKGFFHVREMAKLHVQISWIDAVLASRAAQPALL